MEFARFKAIASFLILLSLVSRSVPCGEIQQQEAPKICFESDLEIEFVESNSTSQAKNFTIQNTVRIVGDQLVEFTFSAHRNYVVRPTYIYPLPPKEENQSPCPDEKEKKEECTKSYLKLGPLSSCELDEQGKDILHIFYLNQVFYLIKFALVWGVEQQLCACLSSKGIVIQRPAKNWFGYYRN